MSSLLKKKDITSKAYVLVLTSTFPRWPNDTEPRFVYDLCQRLKNRYEIIVLSPHCQGARAYEDMDGLKVFRFRYAPICMQKLAYTGGIAANLKQSPINGLLLPMFLFSQWVMILKLLRRFPVAAIHAHWLMPQGVLALVARGFSRVKPAVLCTSHGGDLFSLNDPICRYIKREVICRSDALTVVSSAMQNEVSCLLLGRAYKRLSVIPMGTDLKRQFSPDNTIKRQFFQILFAGRLVEKKGVRYLLDALPDVLQKNPEIQLNIVGNGSERVALEHQAQALGVDHRVNFLGNLPHAKLAEQYCQSTLAVFPFVQAGNGDMEGLGLVTIEALGCECPVIVSDIPAVRDVIVDRETGLLAEAGNSVQLAVLINELVADPKEAKRLASNGRRYVKDKFDWSVTGQAYSDLLESILIRG